jgi:heme-degrading monooxygenase HmoA
LDEAGASSGSIPGRLFRCAMRTDDNQIAVFDVWESEDAFRAFGETLSRS